MPRTSLPSVPRIAALAASVLLASAAWTATPAADTAFQDPLDTPAPMVRLAAEERMLDVAKAGGRLVGVGVNGTILTSDDGGQRWTQAPSPVSTDLTAVAFATPDNGWAVGHDGVILRSRDGGRSWTRQADGRSLDPAMLAHYQGLPKAGAPDLEPVIGDIEKRLATKAQPSLFDIWFADARNGFIVGSVGLILATRDGGESWTPLTETADNPQASHLYAVTGTGSGDGGEVYIAGELGLVLRLDRASGRFLKLPVPYEGTFFSVAADGDRLVVGGLRGHAFVSDDRGEAWTALDTGTRLSIAGTAVLSDGRLALLTQGGGLLAATTGNGRAAPAGPALNRLSVSLTEASPGLVAVATDSGIRRIVLGGPAR